MGVYGHPIDRHSFSLRKFGKVQQNALAKMTKCEMNGSLWTSHRLQFILALENLAKSNDTWASVGVKNYSTATFSVWPLFFQLS